MSVCWSAAGVPEPCGGWKIYDSYTTDPRFQRYFTAAWAGTLAVVLLRRLPALIASLRRADWSRTGLAACFAGSFGVYERGEGDYKPLASDRASELAQGRVRSGPSAAIKAPLISLTALVRSVSRRTPPTPSILSRLLPSRSRAAPSCHPTRTYFAGSVGHLAWALLIPAFILATLLPQSELRANPNRFGFLALACLPPIFVLSVKNGPIAWVVGRGWTAVNFLHRWLGRMLVLLVLLHFYFWTVQYSGAARTAFLAGEKERRGITALAFLLVIFVSSLPPMRRFSYPIFFLLHHVGLIGFLVSINRHTVYAGPWATYIVIGIYASDILGRIASMRVRWVEAEALQCGMVKLSMPGVAGGWRGGQHLLVRLFFVPPSPMVDSKVSRVRRWGISLAAGLRGAVRPFEAHPLSIATAPAAQSLSPEGDRGIELYSRSCGPSTWTDDLYRYVVEAATPLPTRSQKPAKPRKVYLPCLFEGPYGGVPAHEASSLINETETIVLVAGGSGMSFTLGVLESIIGQRRSKNGGAAGRIELVWVVRQRAHLAWFADRLSEVVKAVETSAVRVVIQAFVTCDETLTTSVPDGTASSPSDATRGTEGAAAPPLEATIARFAQLATVSYIRPSLHDLVRESVDRALAPCGHCYPVCRCGELATGTAAGLCANDEEECVGGCGGIANARELVVDMGGKGDEDEKVEMTYGIDELPTLSARKVGPSTCCGGQKEKTLAAADDGDDIVELPKMPSTPAVIAGASSCCAPKTAPSSATGNGSTTSSPGCGGCCSRTNGGGCCTGQTVGPVDAAAVDRDERDRQGGRPLRVRTGGMAVVVCGPGNMVAETRNAVAWIPMAKQVRIGGIACHVEQYSV